MIQAFEFTNKLSWLLLKDCLVDQGVRGISDSRDAVREVVAKDLLPAGKERNWMTMICIRNLKSHTYNPALADDMIGLDSEDWAQLPESDSAIWRNAANPHPAAGGDSMKVGPMHSCAKPRTTLSMLSWRKTTVFCPSLFYVSYVAGKSLKSALLE